MRPAARGQSLIIEQDGIDVEVWSHAETGWTRKVYVHATDEITLPAIGVTLSVAAIYAGAERVPLG